MNKEKTTENKGITLIALIITIIVMLILVTVSITMAVKGGLFKYASDAVKGTKEKMAEEQELASGQITVDGKTYASIDDYLKGKAMGKWYYCVSKTDKTKSNQVTDYVTDGTVDPIEVGSTVNNYIAGEHRYTSEESWEYRWTSGEGSSDVDLTTLNLGKWLILGVGEDGCLELVSENPTSASNVTGNYQLGLRGQDGYTKGVAELNNICNLLYGKGEGAKGARNINEKDIENIATFDKTTYVDEDCGIHYGDEVRLWMTKPNDEDNYYLFFNLDHFDKVALENYKGEEISYNKTDADGKDWHSFGVSSFIYYDENSKTWKELENDKKTNLTFTYYYIYPLNINNSALQKALTTGSDSNNDNYWVASPAVYVDGYNAYFYVRIVDGGRVNGSDLYVSHGYGNGNDYGLRPVVSLKSEVILSAVDGEENTYKIN